MAVGEDLAEDAGAVAEEDVAVAALEDLGLEAGAEAEVHADAGAGREAEELVGDAVVGDLPGEALLVPAGEGALPVAELLIGDVVDRLEVHVADPALAMGHGSTSGRSGRGRRRGRGTGDGQGVPDAA